MINDEHMLWVERYRPHKIADCILPDELKARFQEYVDKKEIPNLLLSGGPGTGKTTVARALCDELEADYIMINGSNESGIDTLRTKIIGYASSVSLTGGRKVVIIDEADYLNPNSTQPAFRAIIEEFAGNCSFIFTCNYKNKIIAPLHSRFSVVEFQLKNEDKAKMATQFMKRLDDILKLEEVEYERKAVIELVKKYFPDYRKTLNELQSAAINGKVNAGMLSVNADIKIAEAITHLKNKDFRNLRLWVGANASNDATKIMREVYDKLYEIVKPEYTPMTVLILGKYLYQDSFVVDHEINLMAFFTEMMLECQFKE